MRRWDLPNDQDVTSLLDKIGAGSVGDHPRGQSVVLAPETGIARSATSNSFQPCSRPRPCGACFRQWSGRKSHLHHRRPGQTPSSMREAANFLNALAEGRKPCQTCACTIGHDIQRSRRQEIDSIWPARWSKAALPFGKTQASGANV